MKKILSTSLGNTMANSLAISAALIVVLGSSGCAPRIGADNVSVRGGVGQMCETLRGVIIAARPVTISSSSQENDNQPGTGAALGAIGGGVLGSQIGGGSGSIIAALAGAGLGGVGGHFLGQALTDQEGMEYQIQLERGGIVTMRQGADPRFSVGQIVMVINSRGGPLNGSDGQGRVVADNSY